MAENVRDRLASIIIPCWNQLEYTRFCLPALVRHTRPPWELIVINNGSTDGTGAYVAGVQDAAPMPVTVVHNERNVGFPAAVNQGLKAARGDYLVLLNNDAVVTSGWLDQLIALTEVGNAKHKEGKTEDGNGDHKEVQEVQEETKTVQPGDSQIPARIGLTGPMSNYASPPQLVENVSYANLEEMHEFARRWREERRGQWFTTTKLSGVLLAHEEGSLRGYRRAR